MPAPEHVLLYLARAGPGITGGAAGQTEEILQP
jgi:hypothetical protein